MPKVDHSSKLDIIKWYREGLTVSKICKRFRDTRGKDFSYQAVNYHLQQYILGNFDIDCKQPPIEKPKPVSTSDVAVIHQTFANNPASSSTKIRQKLANQGTNLSVSTTRRSIIETGFVNSDPRYNGLIRDANKEKRLEFCQQLISNNDSLDNVIFTDESSVQLHQNKVTCYRLRGTLRPQFSKPKHPLKVHVWGGISRKGPTNILIFDGIMESTFFVGEILEKTALPYIQSKFGPNHRFMQDNDPKHRSRLATSFIEDHGINWWKDWPSESCDINPIEMVWNGLKTYIKQQEPDKQPQTKDQLVDIIYEFWYNKLTVEACNRYIDHCFKVAPVCVYLGGKATGELPKHLFKESSRGKSFAYFDSLLKTDPVKDRLEVLLRKVKEQETHNQD